jgi:hypothetical protein
MKMMKMIMMVRRRYKVEKFFFKCILILFLKKSVDAKSTKSWEKQKKKPKYAKAKPKAKKQVKTANKEVKSAIENIKVGEIDVSCSQKGLGQKF